MVLLDQRGQFTDPNGDATVVTQAKMLIASGSYSPRFICSLVAVVAVLAIGTATYHIGLAGDVLTMALWAQFDDQTQGSNSKAPGDPKVVALVFYGRREQVSILDCYLKVSLSLFLPYCVILFFLQAAQDSYLLTEKPETKRRHS